jgi:lysophospholipase L1-like esterase
LNSRIVFTQTSQTTNGQVGAVLRKSPSAPTAYIAYLNASSGTVIDDVVNGSPANLATEPWSVPYNAAHSYSLDFSATGTSPTTLQWIVTDVTSNEVVNTGIVQDSTPSLQAQGEQGLTAWAGSGIRVTFNLPSISTYARTPVTTQTTAPIFLGEIGDSIGLGIHSASYTGVQYEQFFLDVANPLAPVRVSNQAIGGTSSNDWLPSGTDLPEALATFTSVIAAMPIQPAQKFVQIMLGTNDAQTAVSTSSETFIANMTDIDNALVAAGYTVVLDAPNYVVPDSYGLWGSTVNTALATYTQDLQGLVNGTTVLAGWFGGAAFFEANQQDLLDGVHPDGDQGYSILGYEWAKAFLASAQTA